MNNIEFIDYTSLSAYMRCPRQYWWRHIKHIDIIGNKNALINGSAYHDTLSHYYKMKLEGKNHEDALLLSLMGLPKLMESINMETDNSQKYSVSVAVDTINNYFERWKDEPYKTLNTEIGFAIDVGNCSFIGKIDRYIESDFGKMILETKTTTIVGNRWDRRLKPNLQIDGYVSAIFITTGEMPYGAVLDIIPIHEDKKKRQQPFRFITTRTEQDVENWLVVVQQWIKKINFDVEQEFFPMNTDTCTPLLGFECSFTTLCSKYNNPHKIKNIELTGDFCINPWAPFDLLCLQK